MSFESKNPFELFNTCFYGLSLIVPFEPIGQIRWRTRVSSKVRKSDEFSRQAGNALTLLDRDKDNSFGSRLRARWLLHSYRPLSNKRYQARIEATYEH